MTNFRIKSLSPPKSVYLTNFLLLFVFVGIGVQVSEVASGGHFYCPNRDSQNQFVKRNTRGQLKTHAHAHCLLPTRVDSGQLIPEICIDIWPIPAGL